MRCCNASSSTFFLPPESVFRKRLSLLWFLLDCLDLFFPRNLLLAGSSPFSFEFFCFSFFCVCTFSFWQRAALYSNRCSSSPYLPDNLKYYGIHSRKANIYAYPPIPPWTELSGDIVRKIFPSLFNTYFWFRILL